jgi:outer membrane lipoprotein-sorting protein
MQAISLLSKLLLALAFTIVIVAGCGQSTTNLSAEDEKAFKGGPMPPEAKAAMEKGMREASQRAGSQADKK